VTPETSGDRLTAALALIALNGPDVGSVWRHGMGGVYEVLTNAVREADLVPVVVYQEYFPAGLTQPHPPTVWVRPLTEFRDGRFVMVAPAPRRRETP
jgi:hypothetical protein